MGADSELISWLSSDDGFVVHVGLFVLLLLGGIGFPIPEDIPLLLGGVAIAKRIVPADTTFLICYGGVVLADTLMFFAGYFFGPALLRAGTKSTLLPSLTEDKLNEVREGLRKRRLLYIFIGRHLFPVRSVTFLSAGALRIPFLEFFAADSLAALVSVLIMLSIGHWLGDSLTPENIEHLVEEAHVYILGFVIVAGVAYAIRRKLRKSKGSNDCDIAKAEKQNDQVMETRSN